MLIKNCCIINPTKKSILKEINYIDTSSVHDGLLVSIQHLKDNFPSRAQRKVDVHDILISSVRPNLKHNYYVKYKINNCVASTGFIQVRCNPNIVNPRYIYYLLTCKNQIETYVKIADSSQTTFPTFNKDVIENIEVLHKDLSTQQHIVDSIIYYHTFFLSNKYLHFDLIIYL